MKRLSIILSLIGLPLFTHANASFEWLEDESRSKPHVRAYLEEHNQKTRQWLTPSSGLSDELLKQWSNNKEAKADNPWLIRQQHYYHEQTIQDAKYLVKKASETGPIQPLLNLSVRQQKSDYYHLAQWSIDPTGRYLALSEDVTGQEQYRLSIIDLSSQQETLIANAAGTAAIWSQNGQRLYFLALDAGIQANKLQSYGMADKALQTLFEWTDPQWILSIYAAADPQFIMVQVNNENSSEQRILETNNARLSPPLRPAKAGIEYYADIMANRLYINSNLGGEFALYHSEREANSDAWQLFYAPSKDTSLDNFYLFAAGVVVKTGQAHDAKLALLDYQGQLRQELELAVNGEVAWLSRNGDAYSNKLRVRSMSMTTPGRWRELDVAALTWKVLSEDSYPTYSPSHYVSQQIFVEAGGTRVPVTLAYRKDKLTPTSSVFLYGYGAYGITTRPYFMPQIISLLDQGVIYAIAHVRGGGYYGEPWHQAGIGLHKSVGITDYVRVADTLQRYREGQRRIYAIGGSAGGTLVAAAVNQNPALFSGVVLQVPFVDVLGSMSASIGAALSMQQHEEWGNPEHIEQLAAMEAYDPLLNIRPQVYPPTLVRVGWLDNRVPYWEGAKYIAKLSMTSTGTGPYLLLTDFNSGHASDTRRSLQQQAMEYAFLLTLDKNKKAEQ